jgi:voltage-gated potassium channel
LSNKRIIKFSKKLANSPRYQDTKAFFRALLNDVESPYKKYFDTFMIVLIACSTSIVILGKTEEIPPWLSKIDYYVVTALFLLEYLLRLWVAHDMHKLFLYKYKDSNYKYWIILRHKVRYMLSPSALIDFIAIFPQFRIIRLLKLYQYMNGASSLFDALLQKRFEFIFLGYMLLAITFTFGSIFYLLEFEVNEHIHSYLDSLYWALVTISTVGYGDIYPITAFGKMVSMFGIIFGIALISFVTSVMVSAFSERFDKIRNQESIKDTHKMKNVVILHGYGQLGKTIAKKLNKNTKYEAVIIEKDEKRVKSIVEDGCKVIYADASSAKIISRLYRKNNIVALLTLTSSDIDNIYFILNAKSVDAKPIVFSRMNRSELKAQYYASRVDGIVEPYKVVHGKALYYLKKYAIKEKKTLTFFGYSHKSSQIAIALREEGFEIEIIEKDKASILKAKTQGFENIISLRDDYHTLPKLKDTIVICGMHEEAMNVYYTITLRANGFSDKIVILSDSKEDNRKFILSGASKIFDMYEESANQFIEMIEKNEIKDKR